LNRPHAAYVSGMKRGLCERAAPADLAEEVAAGVQRLLNSVARSTYHEALLKLNGVDSF